MSIETPASKNFIRQIIDGDIESGKHAGRVSTRFPPEPSGYLHIGHAQAIWLNFGIAGDYGGTCNLRFDDTNPARESEEYMRSIQEDVRWLGYQWAGLHNASDYFEELWEFAVELINRDKAYVDSLSGEEIREYRGTLTEPGRDSPHRNRSIEENLSLFQRMRDGEFADGEHVLRAKIDMASPNINMRDPVIYRIKHMDHFHTGDKWCVYPMYDFTHCLSDALENITHSLCTLEFEDHRPLYDWFLDNVDAPGHPQQIEFSRLNIQYTLTSKRRLGKLVDGGFVSGWDDPRLATISGIRRRGYPPAAVRDFCNRAGITKKDGVIDMGVLENSVREELNRSARRVLGVLKPLRVVITNYPEGEFEDIEALNHPKDPDMGTRTLPFGREIYIEQDDFMEDPPRKFFRLGPGREVRLRYAYFITCQDIIRDSSGNVTEVHCTYDPESRGGNAPDGRKVKGTIHWVSAEHAFDAEIRLYDRLFLVPDPAAHEDFLEHLNPDSLEVLLGCKLEPGLEYANLDDRFQFERQGYFCADLIDHSSERPVFNRTATLRDSWAKENARQAGIS
jgi:glutaminyl-tRNA synthetase